MKSQSSALFSELSPETASQSKGGHWGHGGYYNCYSTRKVYVTYYPVTYYGGYGGGYSSSSSSTINITNPEFDDGSIVNF